MLCSYQGSRTFQLVGPELSSKDNGSTQIGPAFGTLYGNCQTLVPTNQGGSLRSVKEASSEGFLLQAWQGAEKAHKKKSHKSSEIQWTAWSPGKNVLFCQVLKSKQQQIPRTQAGRTLFVLPVSQGHPRWCPKNLS